MQATGEVVSVNISREKSLTKAPVDSIRLIDSVGVEGDVHAGRNDYRQVSFLNYDQILNHKFCPKLTKKNGQFLPGDFGENITIRGIDFVGLKQEDEITIGADVILKITKVGRNCCKKDCQFNHREKKGCFILKEGMFGYVLQGGIIKKGDPVHVSIMNYPAASYGVS